LEKRHHSRTRLSPGVAIDVAVEVATEQFKLAENGKVFGVADLSLSGMGIRILDQNDLLYFPIRKEIQGTLKIKNEKHEIKAWVRSIRPDQVGCEFHALSPGAQASVSHALSRKD